MATRVWESAIISAPVDSVWEAIRAFDFGFNPAVAKATVEEKKSAAEVGAVITIEYKDKTVQRIKTSEISDAARTVSWELIESVPAVPVLSVVHTIKLRRVTEDNTTFIEWITDFSKDADTNVIADARYKQKDNFAALEAALGRKGQMVGMIYNPEEAKRGVLKVWTDLQALNSANAGELSHEQLTAAIAAYKEFPITYQIDWAIAGLSADAAQAVADELREKLNNNSARLGNNALPLPRLFNAGN